MFNCLAIDIGAGSGRIMRCCITDARKVTLDEVARFGNESRMVDGRLRWNITQLIADIKTGLAKAAAEMKPDAVAVDTWGVDYVFLDKDGKLLNDPLCYRDLKLNGMSDEFTAKFGRTKLQMLTGCQILDLNTLYQLYYEYKQNPDYAAEAEHFLMVPDYIAYSLCGVMANEFTIASTTQLLDCAKVDWSDELLAAVGLPKRCLKKMTKPGTIIGKADYSGVKGLEGVPVVMVGSHDTASGVAGAPASGTDWAYIASGTWCLTGIESAVALPTPRAAELNFTNEGGVAGTWRVLKNLTGFWILRGLKDAVAKDLSYDQLQTLCLEAKPFQSIYDPNDKMFFNPANMKDAVDEYMKKTGQPVPDSIGAYVRAFTESLALLVRKTILEADSISGGHTKVIHIMGGGVMNPPLCQAIADAANCSVMAGPIEATAIGNAMLQAIATGHLSSVTEARALIRSSFEPKVYTPNTSAAWDNAYERFLKLRVR